MKTTEVLPENFPVAAASTGKPKRNWTKNVCDLTENTKLEHTKQRFYYS